MTTIIPPPKLAKNNNININKPKKSLDERIIESEYNYNNGFITYVKNWEENTEYCSYDPELHKIKISDHIGPMNANIEPVWSEQHCVYCMPIKRDRKAKCVICSCEFCKAANNTARRRPRKAKYDTMNSPFCPFTFVKLNDGTLYHRSKKFLYEFEEYEEKQALEEKKRCNDCGVQAGFIHHVCCSCEECPKCGGQFLKCGCERSVETESPYDKDGRRVLLDGTVVINKRLRNARFLQPTGNKIEYLIEAKGV
jgi:hypothetical protein